MAKVRLQNPSTGKFVWVEEAAVQLDGSTPSSAAPSEPQESAPSGPTPRAARPSKPRDDLDEFFDGDGTETVEREDL